MTTVARAMKARMLTEGSLMVDWKCIGGRVPFWRVPLVNPDICRDDIFNVLRILNRIGNRSFPPGSFPDPLSVSLCMSMEETEETYAGVGWEREGGKQGGGGWSPGPELRARMDQEENEKKLDHICSF
mmetsp:Transcript_14332/g.28808  ORF Transcript_14332/g.28808 Transcript_14332/m.28808 type:complete len:128 (+) Transcript_14332:1-384(+)